MNKSIHYGIFFLLPLMYIPGVNAVEENRVLKEDKSHVRAWNLFAAQALELHKKLIREQAHKVRTRTGGYAHNPKFYIEKTYTNSKTGKLISRVQWEKSNPSNLHSVEVFVRDGKGRVIRDYVAAYLPEGRNAPVQALINLHAYNNGLHAFRQFDVSTDVIYEFCEGFFQGKRRQLRLFEDDIANNNRDTRELISGSLYRTCFAGIPGQLGKYIKPQ